MVRQGHEIPSLKPAIDASGGIRQQQIFDPVCCENSDGKGHQCHRVSFVEMGAAAENHHWSASQPPNQ